MQPTTVPFVHSGYTRRLNDHYPTIDPRCVQALVETWRIDGPMSTHARRTAVESWRSCAVAGTTPSVPTAPRGLLRAGGW